MNFPENANSIKFFEHPSFAQVDMRKTITGEMPESDNYEKAYKKIQKIRANKIRSEEHTSELQSHSLSRMPSSA